MTTEITDRQKEIINVSLQIISESGIQGLTIKNIANKIVNATIGFTESAIYRHYENKIQILIAILDFFKDNSQRFFLKETQGIESSIIKIERLFLNHFNRFTSNPSLVAVIFSEEIFRNETVLVEKIQEIMNNNIQSLTNIIETGQKNSEIRTDIEAAYLSTIILGSLRMFVKKWQMSNFSFDLNNQGIEFINSIKILIKS